MTEMLSREKAYIELNEKLDKLASPFAGRTNPHMQPMSPTSAQTKVESRRFATYTRNKGPSTLLKKRGAGDGLPEMFHDFTMKERSTNHQDHQQRPVRPQYKTATSSQPGSVRNTDDELHSGTEGRKNYVIHSTNTTINRKNAISYANKNQDTSNRTFGRTSTNPNRSTVPNNTKFTVKYRNPKFVESPSLEVLVKEGGLSLQENASTATNKDDGSISSFNNHNRRSQATSPRKNHITDGLIKFLKSKIVILEEEHERISVEMAQQKELMEKALERQKKVEQQRDQAYNKHSAVVEQLTKLEAQLDELNQQTLERAMEQTSLKKELDVNKRELKVLTQTNTNLEKRLYRANEELDNSRNAIIIMRNSERELKESNRIECDAKDKQIKNLKKQRADLLNAYKKQLFLIDNLKRQNFCMEQSKVHGFGEKEFNKVLDWNTKT